MEKELTISLKDEDHDKWGPSECALRLLMARYHIPSALIPCIDQDSTRDERDYMCEQLLKEYRNSIKMWKSSSVSEDVIIRHNEIIAAKILKITLIAFFIVAFLLITIL